MTNPNESTVTEKDIRGKSEEELLTPEGLKEYSQVMDFFHQSLYRLETSLFIVDQIEKFPFDLFTTTDDRVFLSQVVMVFMDDTLMTVYKLVVDNEVVSSSLRHLAAIVFGVIPDDNEMKHRETGQLIWERPNLIRFGAELTEKAFQQIR